MVTACKPRYGLRTVAGGGRKEPPFWRWGPESRSHAVGLPGFLQSSREPEKNFHMKTHRNYKKFQNFFMENVWQRSHTFFSSGAGAIVRDCPGTRFIWPPLLCGTVPDFLGKIFSNRVGAHKILVDFRRDARILVHKSRLKFNFQVFCRVIISHRAQNTGLDGLSFQEYHHSPTRALNG